MDSQEQCLQMRTRKPRRGQVPAVEGAALGGDPVVDLGGRVEGELDAAAAEAAEEVADGVELHEPVREDRDGDEGRERVVLRGDQRRRAEQQLAGRLAAGRGRHCGDRTRRDEAAAAPWRPERGREGGMEREWERW